MRFDYQNCQQKKQWALFGLALGLLLLLLLLLERLAKFVGTVLVNGIQISLVEIDNKDDIISQTSQSMHGWHFDDEGEQIVDECVESL